MTWENLANGYKEYLASINRRPKTIHTHMVRVRRFIAFAEGRGHVLPSDIGATQMIDYQRCLSQKANSRRAVNCAAVQNQHLSVVACFFRYLVLAEVVHRNPVAGMEYSREPNCLPKTVLSTAELKRLLKAPDLTTAVGYRDRTILEVLYSCGIRKQELRNLMVQDVDAEEGFLMVRQGKGGKDRVVPVGKMACGYLTTYIKNIRPVLLAKGTDRFTKTLFLSSRGRRLGQNGVNQIVQRCATGARLKRRISPHCLRHAFATHLVRNRANIRHVQEMLGHAKLSTTLTYIRLTIVDLQFAHRKYHPRERNKTPPMEAA